MRTFNFSAGPAVLPTDVLEEAREELLDYQGSGMSIMEQSHREGAYEAVHQEALENIKELLGVPENYGIMFLQGGATGQFAMVPMNLMHRGIVADYTNSGAWATKAIQEARTQGRVHIAASTEEEMPARVPNPQELHLSKGASYLHLTSNETVSGAQWQAFPDSDEPLVADMSSDILSRPIDVSKFGLIYAGAQKNLGPAGVTLVIIRRDLASGVPNTVPKFFRYAEHLKANSLLNTPPTFSIYLVCLVTRWLKKQGGLEAMRQRNRMKTDKLYATIDGSNLYRGMADPAFRSMMNVTFSLEEESLESRFLEEAAKNSMTGLKGHRSFGGIRASIYNALPEAGIDALVAFMREFERAHR